MVYKNKEGLYCSSRRLIGHQGISSTGLNLGAARSTSPAEVLQAVHLVRAKCTAWNLAPGSLGGGSYEVHLIVLSEKASAPRNAPMRLKGVTAVAEAALEGVRTRPSQRTAPEAVHLLTDCAGTSELLTWVAPCLTMVVVSQRFPRLPDARRAAAREKDAVSSGDELIARGCIHDAACQPVSR